MSHQDFRPVGSEDDSAARHSKRPVGESVAGVVRADDEAGPDVKRSARHFRFRRLLAERFKRTVALAGNLFHGRIFNGADRSGLVDTDLLETGVNGDAGNEGVVADGVRKGAGRRRDLAREVATRVDHSVPGSIL